MHRLNHCQVNWIVLHYVEFIYRMQETHCKWPRFLLRGQFEVIIVVGIVKREIKVFWVHSRPMSISLIARKGSFIYLPSSHVEYLLCRPFSICYKILYLKQIKQRSLVSFRGSFESLWYSSCTVNKVLRVSVYWSKTRLFGLVFYNKMFFVLCSIERIGTWSLRKLLFYLFCCLIF